MCYRMPMPDGSFGIICGGRNQKMRYCDCSRPADFLCDWKMPDKKSGTCDGAICNKCALEVASDKHLCKFHQKAYEQWKRRHPEKVVQQPVQMALL